MSAVLPVGGGFRGITVKRAIAERTLPLPKFAPTQASSCARRRTVMASSLRTLHLLEAISPKTRGPIRQFPHGACPQSAPSSAPPRYLRNPLQVSHHL